MSDNVLQFRRKEELPKIFNEPSSVVDASRLSLLQEYAKRRAALSEKHVCEYIDTLARVADTETAMVHIEKYIREMVDEDLKAIRRGVREDHGLTIDVVFREMMLAKLSPAAGGILEDLRSDPEHIESVREIIADETTEA